VTSPPKTILLFDIDGTLVSTGGAGKLAMEGALQRAFGVEIVRDVVPYSGRTDVAIARDLLVAHDRPSTPADVTFLVDTYLDSLPASLTSSTGRICPGIETILGAVGSRPEIGLGLLTGNVERGARLKLGHFGIWQHFRYGGFGDRHADRNDVARTAYEAACTHHGCEIDPRSVWVIGDTPLDVSCARAIGANVLAVATGWHALEELQACEPDLALADCSDADALFRLWC